LRKLSASYVFPVSQPPVRNGILETDEDGTILGLSQPENPETRIPGVEYYDGIIIPGLVNTHCHLELSYLKGKISQGSGLGGFIGAINKLRNLPSEDREISVIEADRELYRNGVVAVGDISNSISSLNVKLNNPIYYHTFAETFGFLPARAERAFDLAEMVFKTFSEFQLPVSIVPHSPYSVSEPLFKKILAHAVQNQGIISLHHQESNGENQFFRNGTGPIADHLKNNLGLDISGWKPTGKTSTESILDCFPSENKLILVHNTHTTASDIEFIGQIRPMDNTFFCVCPNSNLFIENQLPDIHLFREKNVTICIGTDSLSSNKELSILAEMITIQSAFPVIPAEELIKWACLNGARALNAEDRFGSFDQGKKPGINLLSNLDLANLRLLPDTSITKLA
jgi:aminodeoxyfutalosine deaminase